ncbi:hypothetical protein X777_16731 [Ooceraea biroi]|uniref:Uncharacterized protein n=1 Tax=Ooceraea biroi TaxID=2015173 RepID=A0A026WUE5_OOCBI|nr:hypothetical protein X777_16731 [Ooceraea biroi]
MVVSNPDLTPVEQLHYLKTQVTGEASRLIVNIQMTSENFSRAWKALTSRYENKRALVTANLDRLFELKSMIQASSSDLKLLLSTVKECTGSLKSLDVPVQHWDLFLVYFVTRKLHTSILEAWEIHLGESTDLATFLQLETFLEGRIRALEAIQSSRLVSKSSATQKSSYKTNSARTHAIVVNKSGCSYCSAAHYIAACPDFAAKSLDERHEFIVKKNLCFNCLGTHRLSECRCVKRCRRCKSQHHTLLHRETASSSVAPVASTSSHTSPSNDTSSVAGTPEKPVALSHVAVTVDCSDSPTILATAKVRILVTGGNSLVVRALLDQGSKVSFIRESLVQLLRLPRHRSLMHISGVGSRDVGATRGVVSLRLQSCVEPSDEFILQTYILPQLTGKIPSEPITYSWEHLQGLPFADPDFAIPGPIDLLLGANIYGLLLKSTIRKGPLNAPVAQETSLGWIVSRPTSQQSR